MGKYLDKLKACVSTDTLGKAVSKVSEPLDAIPLDTFDTDPLRVSEKLAAYLDRLAIPATWDGRALPPTPPFCLGEPGHGAAWGAWWDAVGRLPGRGVAR